MPNGQAGPSAFLEAITRGLQQSRARAQQIQGQVQLERLLAPVRQQRQIQQQVELFKQLQPLKTEAKIEEQEALTKLLTARTKEEVKAREQAKLEAEKERRLQFPTIGQIEEANLKQTQLENQLLEKKIKESPKGKPPTALNPVPLIDAITTSIEKTGDLDPEEGTNLLVEFRQTANSLLVNNQLVPEELIQAMEAMAQEIDVTGPFGRDVKQTQINRALFNSITRTVESARLNNQRLSQGFPIQEEISIDPKTGKAILTRQQADAILAEGVDIEELKQKAIIVE